MCFQWIDKYSPTIDSFSCNGDDIILRLQHSWEKTLHRGVIDVRNTVTNVSGYHQCLICLLREVVRRISRTFNRGNTAAFATYPLSLKILCYIWTVQSEITVGEACQEYYLKKQLKWTGLTKKILNQFFPDPSMSWTTQSANATKSSVSSTAPCVDDKWILIPY